jgi:hypothetical protein
MALGTMPLPKGEVHHFLGAMVRCPYLRAKDRIPESSLFYFGFLPKVSRTAKCNSVFGPPSLLRPLRSGVKQQRKGSRYHEPSVSHTSVVHRFHRMLLSATRSCSYARMHRTLSLVHSHLPSDTNQGAARQHMAYCPADHSGHLRIRPFDCRSGGLATPSTTCCCRRYSTESSVPRTKRGPIQFSDPAIAL